jgi:uncharacterized protein (TIGR02453 family)
MQKVLSYLKKLKSNNNRDWFEANRGQFVETKGEFEAFCAKVLQGIKKFDKKIDADSKASDFIFRIYRDVRFSKDKTPYKNHFSASMNPGGRKSATAGYYLHIEPGGSFVAGGVWQPEPAMLQAIRQEIDYHPAPLIKTLKSAAFKKYYKDLDEDGKLKTLPKGYNKEHPNIELLRHRNFIVSHSFSDKTIVSPKGASEIINAFKAMYPMIVYLRTAQDVPEQD